MIKFTGLIEDINAVDKSEVKSKKRENILGMSGISTAMQEYWQEAWMKGGGFLFPWEIGWRGHYYLPY